MSDNNTTKDIIPFQPYVEGETFFANGGKIIAIQNPTPEALIPFLDKLNEQYPLLSQMILNTNPERYFYLMTQWGIDKYISDYFREPPVLPQLTFSLAKDNTICAFVYTVEEIIDGIKTTWYMNWVGLAEYKGAGTACSMIANGVNMRYGKPLATTIDQKGMNPALFDALEDRPFIVQDPTTLWHTVSFPVMLQMIYNNYDFAQLLPNMSKIIPHIPTLDENCVYSWKEKIWYAESQAPEDLGTPFEFEPSQVYEYDIDSSIWIPTTLPWL